MLLPPHAVRPYITRNKTDRADAKGILEAYRNADIRPVPIKSVTQHTLGALHRVRSAWVASRTARINAVRGFLRELGLTLPLGARHLRPRLLALLEDADSPLPMAIRPMLAEAAEEIREFETRIRGVEQQLEQLSRQLPVVRRLRTIPGVGLLSATALVAFVGDVQRFPSARHFASYLGLTPRERSSGLARRLGAISKRGDTYLRTLLIHGARAVLCRASTLEEPDRLRAWALGLQAQRGHNKAAVALANKIARLVWVVWKRDVTYQSTPAA